MGTSSTIKRQKSQRFLTRNGTYLYRTSRSCRLHGTFNWPFSCWFHCFRSCCRLSCGRDSIKYWGLPPVVLSRPLNQPVWSAFQQAFLPPQQLQLAPRPPMLRVESESFEQLFSLFW